jgi:uncharacterized protein (TIGR02996 family)
MSDRKALLSGVTDEPDDDAPRLVMADWFEENGEPDRAEFIRLQIGLAREDVEQAEEPVPLLSRLGLHRIGDADRQRRMERVRALHKAHHREWESEVAAWARGGADFCRGFIAHLRATAKQWLQGAAGLHRSAPVTDLFLTKTHGLWGELARCPQLARISSLLVLGGLVSAKEAAALAASPHLGRLRSLRLLSAPQPQCILILAAAPWPDLRALLLEGAAPEDVHAITLANNPASKSLLKLDLSDGTLGPAAAEALAGSPHLGRLAYLRADDNPLADAGAPALVRSARLPALTSLFLGECEMTPAGAEALAGEPGLARLRVLDLSDNPLGDRGAIALAGSPHAAGLRRLALRSCGVTNAGALALAQSSHLRDLRSVELCGGNTIGAKAQARLRERFHVDL